MLSAVPPSSDLGLGAARIDKETGKVAAAVLTVNVDGDEVVLVDAVAVAHGLGGMDALRLAVQAVEGDIQMGLVRADPGLGLVGRRDGGGRYQRVESPPHGWPCASRGHPNARLSWAATAHGATAMVCRAQAAGMRGLGMSCDSTPKVGGVSTTCGRIGGAPFDGKAGGPDAA